jgi:hypothetical protein
VVDGIRAAATDADYFDDGRLSLWEIKIHVLVIYALSSARFTPLETSFIGCLVGLSSSITYH